MIPRPLSDRQLALLRQVHYGTRELLKAELGRGAPKTFDPVWQRGQPVDPDTFDRFSREGLIQNVKAPAGTSSPARASTQSRHTQRTRNEPRRSRELKESGLGSGDLISGIPSLP
jgi:hypothetical protein